MKYFQEMYGAFERKVFGRSFVKPYGCILILSILATVMILPVPVQSQSVAEKFGGFSTKSNKPINIQADELQVDDKSKTAMFIGDVTAEQEGFKLRSKTLEVLYDGNAAAGANGKVKKLTARGKVLIETQDKQEASSEWAIFDVVKQTILLGDKVILTQGENIVRGGRLEIDLKTSRSRFINKKKGRVQMKIDVPPQKKKTKNKLP